MANTSKELLHLELKNPSSPSIESTLLVCKNDSLSQNKNTPHLDGKPITAPVPTSQVLGKVKDFLGIISEANERLQLDAKNNCDDYDIEVLTGKESKYIEMDLMLGVADLHTPEAVAAAESAIAGSQPIIPLAASSSGTESEDSSEDDNNSEDDDNEEEDDESSDNGNNDVDDNRACSTVKFKRSKSGEDDSLVKASGNRQSKKRPKIVELS